MENKENDSNFEIVLPDGTVYNGKTFKKEHTIQGYDPDGQPKKMKFSTKTACERCGKCCITDTPMLLKEDMPLLMKGVITENDIYTIREGERIRSFIDGEIYEASMEMIKIRPIFGSSTCLFYDPQEGCTIYDSRPTVCREFECWRPNISITGVENRRLTRKELFRGLEILNEAIDRHEEKCSLVRFGSIVDEFVSGKEENFQTIVETIIYDQTIRDWCMKKLEIKADLIPLIFGRSIVEIASMYGLIIEKDGENFIIKVMEVGK